MADRAAAHRMLGFVNFAQCAERVLGYTPRVTDERLRVAKALQDLPKSLGRSKQAASAGRAVRELTRVASPTTERKWLDTALGRTIREIEAWSADIHSAPSPMSPKIPRQKSMPFTSMFGPKHSPCFAKRPTSSRVRLEFGFAEACFAALTNACQAAKCPCNRPLRQR